MVMVEKWSANGILVGDAWLVNVKYDPLILDGGAGRYM